ncbi:MAG: hypothetical protein V1727_02270 [Candidatus Omnitrophota bacterium]
MKMTPVLFGLFRLYNLSLGRFAWGERLLRKVLVALLIKGKGDGQAYSQASSYFAYAELEKQQEKEQ